MPLSRSRVPRPGWHVRAVDDQRVVHSAPGVPRYSYPLNALPCRCEHVAAIKGDRRLQRREERVRMPKRPSHLQPALGNVLGDIGAVPTLEPRRASDRPMLVERQIADSGRSQPSTLSVFRRVFTGGFFMNLPASAWRKTVCERWQLLVVVDHKSQEANTPASYAKLGTNRRASERSR